MPQAEAKRSLFELAIPKLCNIKEVLMCSKKSLTGPVSSDYPHTEEGVAYCVFAIDAETLLPLSKRDFICALVQVSFQIGRCTQNTNLRSGKAL